MSATPSTLDRIRCHLVGLKMPRALEVLEHTLRQLERGEVSALEAIDALLGEELSLREGRRGFGAGAPATEVAVIWTVLVVLPPRASVTVSDAVYVPAAA